MSVIVGVRFKKVGKIYYFAPNGIELAVGDGVIIETARGVEFGKVVIPPREEDEANIVKPLKPVIRKATEADIAQVLRNISKRDEAMRLANEKIKKHELEMKLTDAEYTFDAQKVIFYFTAEGRIDFRELVRDLASVFKVRIELRQIGIRDESKTIGGIAPCGRVCCCAQFLGDFEKSSIKMAKTQGLSLNPTKISGLCGRLMCCLSYENEHYAETSKFMPKQGSLVSTPEGKGIVFSNDMLRRRVSVKMDNESGIMEIKTFDLSEVKFNGKTHVDHVDEDDHVDEELAVLEDTALIEDRKPKKPYEKKDKAPRNNNFDGNKEPRKDRNFNKPKNDKFNKPQEDKKDGEKNKPNSNRPNRGERPPRSERPNGGKDGREFKNVERQNEAKEGRNNGERPNNNRPNRENRPPRDGKYPNKNKDNKNAGKVNSNNQNKDVVKDVPKQKTTKVED